ncbi:bifunctional 3-demethylubiquinone 3-O-methyltransferase/2-octaprenyl-6-hydroxy phenol methylase [Treponema sp.]
MDEEFYNKHGSEWWTEEESPFKLIRYMMNPLRFAYTIKHLIQRNVEYRGMKVLDIGCGGGFLTEEIAKFGMDAYGIDPSGPSLAAARRHAEAMNLDVEYLEGFGERLPFADASFDMVFCLDVLEHVQDYRAIVKEVSRVLKPGGLFFFETINKTLLSFCIVILFMQEFPLTRLIPQGVHDWKYFIRPKKLKSSLKENGFVLRNIQGILPGLNLLYNLFLVRRKVMDKITFHDLCKLFNCHESFYKGLCYIGFAELPS